MPVLSAHSVKEALIEFVVHLEWVGKYSISVEFQSAGGWFIVRRYHPSSGWVHEYRSKATKWDSSAYWEGQDAGSKVSIDQQIDEQKRKGIA